MENVKNLIEEEIKNISDRISYLKHQIINNPELDEDEKKAAKYEYKEKYVELDQLERTRDFIEESF